MISRLLRSLLEGRYNQGKAIIVLGPRQVGKTTLLKTMMGERPFLFLDGDDPDVRMLLSNIGYSKLKAVIGSYQWVFIDEAQRIENIGLVSKMIIDRFPEVQLFVSGSSALEISNSMQEPLTGRKFEYHLYPISWQEFEDHVGMIDATSQLNERLVFGMYPDVINHRSDAREVLKQLTVSYLYRDVLAHTGIKKPEVLDKLLKALALQLGSEVSYSELAQLLEIDKATVSRYIDLLEKSFIVFRLTSFSRNLRNEIRNNRKIYFYDNGIRNMIINNLNDLDLRNDKGALWENFLISERMKMLEYHGIHTNQFFWRTVQKQEIDYIEERNGQINAFEFKWNSRGKVKIPKSFIEKYSAMCSVIDKDNFRDFVRF